MSLRSKIGLYAGLAMMLGGGGALDNIPDMDSPFPQMNQKRNGGFYRKKAELTPKQKKARAANKRSRKARRNKK